MQQLVPLTKKLADAFDRIELSYAFGGALANNYWGTVRATVDIDCLVAIPQLKYQAVADELTDLGGRMHVDPNQTAPVTVGAMRVQLQRHKFIEVFCDSIRVELFVPLVPLQHEILRRAVRLPLAGRDVHITTAEDLILLKMAFHRDKDLRDICGMLWVQRRQLDYPYIRKWSEQMLEDASARELDKLIARYAEDDEGS